MRVSLFVFALLALFAGIDAQRYFQEQIPSGVSWSAREKANVEFVKRQTTFRDGNGRQVALNNYFVRIQPTHSNQQRNTTSPPLSLPP
jgi:hypothetical protein